jgi:hypothetical protein
VAWAASLPVFFAKAKKLKEGRFEIALVKNSGFKPPLLVKK